MVPKKLAVLLLGIGWLALIVACGGGGGTANSKKTNSTGEATTSGNAATPNAVMLDPEIVAVMDRAHFQNEAAKQTQIEVLRAEAKQLRRRNQRSRAQAVDQKADDLEDTLFMPLPTIRAPINQGEFGYVDENLHIVSIPNASNVLVRAEHGEFDSQMLWIESVSTVDQTTDKIVRLKSPYRAVGTREYTTVLGATNRVIVLKPFDPEPYLQKYRDELAERRKTDEKPEAKPLTPDELIEKKKAAAAAKLRLAKQLMERGETGDGKRWLEDLVRDYPDTPAAAEAQQLLDQSEP